MTLLYARAGLASLAGSPKHMIENPDAHEAGDVLSNVLRTVRLSGSLQFCFMPTGAWRTDPSSSMKRLAAGPSTTMPFHILVEGSCWLKMGDQRIDLAAGDVVAFPLGTPHDLGAGVDGRIVNPLGDLPPKPWRQIPVLQYGEERSRVRLLCGYLQCEAMNFRPLQDALPALLHVRTETAAGGEWLCATIRQIVSEVEKPRTGGVSMLERLTEITFIELLRHEISKARPGSTGWMAALAEPSLRRCIALIHDDPQRDWSVQDSRGGLRCFAQHTGRAVRDRAQHLADALRARVAAASCKRGVEHDIAANRVHRIRCRIRDRGGIQSRLLTRLRHAALGVEAERAWEHGHERRCSIVRAAVSSATQSAAASIASMSASDMPKWWPISCTSTWVMIAPSASSCSLQ